MTREEYKVRLKAHFLFNNIDIPEWAIWIAIDYDGELYVFSDKPKAEDYDLADGKTEYVWLCYGSVKREYGLYPYIEFEFNTKETLVSVKELFDE